MVKFSYKLRNGATITVEAPESEAPWLRLLFATNARPFKALAEMGLEPVVTLPAADA